MEMWISVERGQITTMVLGITLGITGLVSAKLSPTNHAAVFSSLLDYLSFYSVIVCNSPFANSISLFSAFNLML